MIPHGEETGPPGVSEYATHYGAQHACTQKQARRGRSIRAYKYERRQRDEGGQPLRGRRDFPWKGFRAPSESCPLCAHLYRFAGACARVRADADGDGNIDFIFRRDRRALRGGQTKHTLTNHTCTHAHTHTTHSLRVVLKEGTRRTIIIDSRPDHLRASLRQTQARVRGPLKAETRARQSVDN